MKPKGFGKITLWGAAVMLCSSMFFSMVRAQCPTYPCPTGWTCGSWSTRSEGPVTLTGTTCEVNYTECIRTVIDQYGQRHVEEALESVTPVPGCTACYSIAPDSIIKSLLHQIELECICPDEGPPPPQCGSDTTLYQDIYAMACWEMEINGSGDTTYVTCSNSGDYCELTCKVCQDGYNGPYVFSDCSDETHDSGSCNSLPSPDVWVLGACYDIGYCQLTQ